MLFCRLRLLLPLDLFWKKKQHFLGIYSRKWFCGGDPIAPCLRFSPKASGLRFRNSPELAIISSRSSVFVIKLARASSRRQIQKGWSALSQAKRELEANTEKRCQTVVLSSHWNASAWIRNLPELLEENFQCNCIVFPIYRKDENKNCDARIHHQVGHERYTDI